jgi:hypothetical protein
MLRFSLSSTSRALRFLALSCAAAVTLRAQAPPAVPKLAVEIRVAPGEEPSIVIVEQDSGVDTDVSTPSFLPLPDYESKDHSPVQPSNLDMSFRLHGDVMDIVATLSFVPVSERDKPKERGKYPPVELGSFHGRLGDTISFDKMTELGFQPATLKIVSAERHSTTLPMVNHVPSITARVASQDSAGYRISLHNLSAQGVMALMGRDALKGGNTEIAESRGGIPMIAANGNHELQLGCEDSRDTNPNDSDREPVPCAFVLEAALFSDGSYEGDVDSAAMLDMGMLARHSQVLRIRQALQVVLDDKSVPESSRIARMRAEVSNLSYEPDATIKERLRLKYPGVSESVLKQVDAYMQGAFDSMQTATLLDLQGIENSPQPSKSVANLLASAEMN